MSKWEGIDDPTLESFMDKMAAECDARSAAWIEAHKDDPCEVCGTHEKVTITPTGSLARLTPLCERHHELLRCETDGYWRGFDAGRRMERARPWWQRLFNK